MSKIYDVYNLDEDLELILDDIKNESEEKDSFVKDCYEALSEREGFIDYVKDNDDGLFYSCLYDLVSRRRLADNRLQSAMREARHYGFTNEDIFDHFNIETMDESIDNAIYNNYGLEARNYLTNEYVKKLGIDEDFLAYETLGVSRGKVVIFKGGIPKD